MSFKNFTIKRLLALCAIVITVILISIGLFTNHFLRSTFIEYEAVGQLKDIQQLELNIRKAEKEFLMNESSNVDFHRGGVSNYIDIINSDLDVINEQIEYLKQSNTINELFLVEKLDETKLLFIKYQTYMKKMASLVLQKGFKDYGLVGKMRDQIHTVESELKNHENKDYLIYMLTLRRHEKDYLLRKDLQYLDKFTNVYKAFKENIESSQNAYDLTLIPLLDKYYELFNQVIQTDINIGLNTNQGLHYNIGQTIENIESNLLNLSQAVEFSAKKKISKTTNYMFGFISILSLVIILLILQVSRHIIQSISNLHHYITRLGKGELPEKIPIYNNDEIAHMKASINELTSNLKNTKDFAIAVGNGNFEQEIDVFGNRGDLGSALVEMRQKLLQVSQERNDQIKASEERLWANEGLSQIHSLITSLQNNNHEFYYEVISNLTKYLKANQGTLFIIDDVKTDIELKQVAAYAFDRKRICDKNIILGEGLIGAVAFEKQSIYMTKIPDNYINITSGLGDARPNCLLIVPCLIENELMGIIELASFNTMEPYEIHFAEQVANDVANNLRKIKIEETTQVLLQKTQKQTTELQEKEEEMRMNLEELQTIQETLELKENELLKKMSYLEKENSELKNQMQKQKSYQQELITSM